MERNRTIVIPLAGRDYNKIIKLDDFVDIVTQNLKMPLELN